MVTYSTLQIAQEMSTYLLMYQHLWYAMLLNQMSQNSIIPCGETIAQHILPFFLLNPYMIQLLLIGLLSFPGSQLLAMDMDLKLQHIYPGGDLNWSLRN